jgi:cytochrome c553
MRALPRMPAPRAGLTASVLFVFVGHLQATQTIAKEPPNDLSFFEKSIQPILKAKCFRCHGRDSRKSDLDLSTLIGIEKGGESGLIIDREQPEESLLFEYVRDRSMPPEGEPKLSDQEVEIICRWIREGADLPANSVARGPVINQHDVMPIFQLHCSVCHGSRIREADLDIRTRSSLLKGGKSGPAIVLGNPGKSLILQRIHAGEMPPHRKLVEFAVKPMSKMEIDTLARWIAAGGPEELIEPDVATNVPDKLVSDQDRQFWSFQPPRSPPVPTVKNTGQVRTSIDNFILRRLEAENRSLSPEVDRATFIRRATFDLIGLPPTPPDVQTFVSDDDPRAYDRLIDRLLNSQRYGERWGQHWLDLAGYADSEGVVNSDPTRKHAYRYRDYVIRAFNADKPYDRFLLEQLAGDELANYEQAEVITEEIYDNLVATAFLRLAPDGTFESLTGFVPDRLELIDDEIEVFSSAVLGLTIKCARCHSHKFDPIPQRDYYRLAAIFKGALDENDWLKPNRQAKFKPGERDRMLPYVTTKEHDAWKTSGGKPEDQPLIRALWDRGEPSPTYLLRRGNHLTPGRLIGPGVPSVLTDGKTPLKLPVSGPDSKKTGRRLALAKWMVAADHPLTSRVMVNRIWKHHFETGIVKTLDNFGKAGARPTHPELLDWLAVRFIQNGWSIKSMHRLIMTSAVYRQSSQVTSGQADFDLDNELLSRMPLRRMEAEVVRDSLLHAAGKLDLTPFGPADPITARADGLVTSAPYGKGGQRWRRSIYVLKRRSQPVTILQNFDVAGMDPNCIERRESIVAPQALHLSNNQMVRSLAQALADRVWKQAKDSPSAQVELAYRLATGRGPNSEELRVSLESLQALSQKWEEENPGTRHTLVATTHLWIREIEPERVFEDDLISVWSRRSSDKGRRFGLVEFDISSVADLDLKRAHLELGVLDTKPIRQSAAVIAAGIDGYNWSLYQKNKSDQARPITGLGSYRFDMADERVGGYVAGSGATLEELKLIKTKAQSDGRLTLVLMADEDGTAYRRDWDDGVYRGTRNNPPRLVIHDSRRDPQVAARNALRSFCHTLINSAAFLYID